VEVLMVDYGKLADGAKQRQDAENVSTVRNRELKVAPKAFFEKVRAHLFVEINKANAELLKRGIRYIDQNHLSGFDNEIFLTYGTDVLCRIMLNTLAGKCQITAISSGPPNGYELLRKEYPFNNDVSGTGMLLDKGAEFPAVEPRSEDIAVDIISSILVGKFD
jgi:hypothetical protein